MTIRAPLHLAPKASALPAPPAPINANVLPVIGEVLCGDPLLLTRLSIHAKEMQISNLYHFK